METLIRAGAQAVGSSLSARGSTSNLSPCSTSGSSVQSVPRGSFIRLNALDRSVLRQKVNRSSRGETVRPVRIRAEQSSSGIDEKVREIASDEAVEGPEIAQRDAESKADELNSGETEATELPIAAELLLNVLKEEDESVEKGVEKEMAVDVASDSAVEDPESFFHDVEEDARELAADLGRSLEDEILELETEAEELEEREMKEAQLVNQKEFGEEGELTRDQVQQKIVETAQDGIEVLKWAAEGIVSAGQNAGEGLGAAQEGLDKRIKSFGIAADETRDVSSQVAGVAQKNFEGLQTSASKFGEELQVNIEEKKAADSLKAGSERDPLAKLNENFSKAAQAGKDFTTRVSERAEAIQAENSSSTGDLKNDYEDERGNELLKGQISSADKDTTLKFDADEAQAVPSKKEDGSDIGHDE